MKSSQGGKVQIISAAPAGREGWIGSGSYLSCTKERNKPAGQYGLPGTEVPNCPYAALHVERAETCEAVNFFRSKRSVHLGLWRRPQLRKPPSILQSCGTAAHYPSSSS